MEGRLTRAQLSQSRPSPPGRFASLRDRHSPTLDPPPAEQGPAAMSKTGIDQHNKMQDAFKLQCIDQLSGLVIAVHTSRRDEMAWIA